MPDGAVAALREAGVVVAYLFGSRAAGRHRPDSDADVAVVLTDPSVDLPLVVEAQLAERLAQALGVARVDLTVAARAPLELRSRVVREGRVLFSDDEAARVRFEVDTQSRWFDVEPAYAEQTAAFLRRVAAEGLGG